MPNNEPTGWAISRLPALIVAFVHEMNFKDKRLEVGAHSETGYVREENQDRMSGTEVALGHLFIVADGMGGHKSGALAAELAVQELQRQIREAAASEPVERVLQTAFKKANETIYQKAHSGDATTEGMGTTAVVLLISGKVGRLAHVGDSRAYLYRDGELTQLTRDHTMVQKMVQAGMLEPEDAADHPNASVLERAVGTHPTVEADISKELPLVDGDAILLCSDGLCGYARDNEIQSVLRANLTAQETTARLIELALQKGGKDNVTVQFVQYGPRKEPPLVEAAKPANPAAAMAGSRNPGPALESTKTDKPATITSKPRHNSFPTAAAFVLGAVLSAGGFYVLLNTKTAELEAVNQSMSKLQKELAETKAAQEDATKEAANLQQQLVSAGQTAKTIAKLQKELQETKSAQKDATKEVADLKQQLVLARQSAKTKTDKLESEFKKSEAAKKTAETNVADLKRQLNEKDIQLQEAKKQLQSATTKTPKEPGNATAPEGATAPGKASGSGATKGQKETSETK